MSRGAREVDRTAAPVRAEGVDVVLGGQRILRGVDLAVDAGETVALLGANGSGKSTLVKALVGLVPVSRGRARLFGADLARGGRDAWSRIGYVPQRVTAAPGVPATAAEVVASGLLSGTRLRIGREGRRRALEALEQVGLAERAAESVQVFSGGQQQRVLIARALVRRPELLLLDEPLAGMDSISKRALADTLGELREEGTTVLVVLHETGELAPLLDRAVVLRHGRVVHDGAMPRPVAGHDAPGHEHLHPHADQTGPDHHVPGLSVDRRDDGGSWPS